MRDQRTLSLAHAEERPYEDIVTGNHPQDGKRVLTRNQNGLTLTLDFQLP